MCDSDTKSTGPPHYGEIWSTHNTAPEVSDLSLPSAKMQKIAKVTLVFLPIVPEKENAVLCKRHYLQVVNGLPNGSLVKGSNHNIS